MSCDETSFTSINQGGDVMDSMANGYSISVVGMNVDSHSENEHSWTENSLTSTFRYLEEIVAEANSIQFNSIQFLFVSNTILSQT